MSKATVAADKFYCSTFDVWDTARKEAGLEDLRLDDLFYSFALFLIHGGRRLRSHADDLEIKLVR